MKARTTESIAMQVLKPGSFFYTHKQDRHVTAIATNYQRKVKTERVFIVNPQLATLEKITKVTLL
jgi:hypothetical protein